MLAIVGCGLIVVRCWVGAYITSFLVQSVALVTELNLLYETSERIRDTPISIKDAPVNHVSKPALHYGKPFCSGKFNLVHVHWNNGDH